MKVRVIAKTFVLLFIATAIISCSNDDELTDIEEEFVPIAVSPFPNAEYQQARIVLMHTPGEEMRNQQGEHKVFDVEGMRDEHFQFMTVLKTNGIQVYELTNVLSHIPVSKLRETARRMFSGDVQSMGKQELIQYMIVRPPLKGLYFTRDQSITTPRGQILCKMTKAHRKYEPELIALCYQYLGGGLYYQVCGETSRVEGGDYLPFGTLSFIGEGERTNRDGIIELMQADAFGHDTIVVVKDALRNSLQMHLDTYFNIIDADLVSLPLSRINATKGDRNYVAIDVYVREKGMRDYRLEIQDGSLVSFLREKGIGIVPISNIDQKHFASNYLCIAPRHIVAIEGLSDEFKHKMDSLHVQVEWVKLSELTEGDGGAHCMTQVLCRSW